MEDEVMAIAQKADILSEEEVRMLSNTEIASESYERFCKVIDTENEKKLSDINTRLARLRVFVSIVINLNRGGTAKLRSEEEVNAAPFFKEDLDTLEKYLKGTTE